MLMLFVYALIAIVISFLCSVLEAVLLSIPPSYVARRHADGSSIGRRLAGYKRNVDQPLAAILTLNTFAHTIGAAGVGAEAAEIWGSNVLGIVSAIMTVVILIASEIIPKTIGAVYWRQLASVSVRLLQLMIILLWPLVKLCGLITHMLRPGGHKPLFQRGDFRDLADAGHHSGILRRDERIIISNLLRFDKLQVKDIMTPREKIVALPADKTVLAVHPRRPIWWNTRMPVYNDKLDNCTGYVLKEDILAARIENRHTVTVGELQRALLEVHAEDSLHGCYEALAEKSAHIALVRDNAGAVVGIISMEDLIETMLGLDIDDEDEPPADDDEIPDDERLQRRSRPDIPAVSDTEEQQSS